MAGSRRALVIAVDTYDDPGLSDLVAPAADADALEGVLGDPALGGFDVEVLRNEVAAVITERLEAVTSELRPDDFLLIHFSGHGLKDDSTELYLAARNTKLNRLASTAIDAALIDRLLRRSRAQRIVLFLDCCYGGAFEKGVVARASGSAGVGEQFHQDALGAGRGRVVITASTAVEYAFEGSALTVASTGSPSLFSGAIVEGLRSGDADRDEDGQVSLDELYDYVYDEVRRQSPRQTPSKWEYGMQGSVTISRAPRRRVTPGRLPQDLLELMANGYASLRLGAVGELTRIAGGDDLPAAAAAHAGLQRLAEDDSRAVSTAALEALTAGSLRLTTSHHDFGIVEVSSDPPLFETRLEGSPLARVAEVSSAPSHLRAHVVDGTLVVRPLTTTVGGLSGRVVVRGPAGTASLEVEGSVLPVQAGPAEARAAVDRADATTSGSGPATAGVAPEVEEPPVRSRRRPVDHDLRRNLGWDVPQDAREAPPRPVAEAPQPAPAPRDPFRVHPMVTSYRPMIAVLVVSAVLVVAFPILGGVFDDEGMTEPSLAFRMTGPWELRVSTTDVSQVCYVQIYDAQGQFVDSSIDEERVLVDETGAFTLSWAEGDETGCSAVVQEQAGGPVQRVEPLTE